MKKINLILIIFLIIPIIYPTTSKVNASTDNYIKFTGKTIQCSTLLGVTDAKKILKESSETMQSTYNFQLDSYLKNSKTQYNLETHEIKKENEYSVLQTSTYRGITSGLYLNANSNGGKYYGLYYGTWKLNYTLDKNTAMAYLKGQNVDYQAIGNYANYKNIKVEQGKGQYEDFLILKGKTKLTTIFYPSGIDRDYYYDVTIYVDRYTKHIHKVIISTTDKSATEESIFSNMGNVSSNLSYDEVIKGVKAKPQPFKNIVVNYFDVGHGDATLIITTNKEAILIDGGKNSDYSNKILEVVNENKIKKISSIIISHPHKDHIGGLVNIVNSFPVDSIYINDMSNGLSTQYKPNESYRQLKTIIEKKKIKTIKVVQNSCLPYKDTTAIFLAPKSKINYSNLNNNSNVLLLKHRNMKFLFTGDIQKEAETNLINEYKYFKINVLKVPHHGSKTSSTPNFIKNIRPDYAIISTNNKELTSIEKDDSIVGNVSGDIVNNSKPVKIYSTQRSGNITLLSNGNKISIDTER